MKRENGGAGEKFDDASGKPRRGRGGKERGGRALRDSCVTCKRAPLSARPTCLFFNYERTLTRGVDISNPNVSEGDISEARTIGYEPGAHNIVFAGNLNAVKSSLLNAIRNRTPDDDDYAPTGASEVTLQRRRYTDPLHDGFIWYDTPGAGTQGVTAYNYYYSQQLYAYDLVVLIHESTLTQVSIN